MKIIKFISEFFSPRVSSSNVEEVWHHIVSEEDIKSILLASNERTQVVYKHSPSCGVSYFALRNLNDPQLFEKDEIDLHLIDVITQRSLSMDFAERVGIRHESPQIFVIKDGKIKWHASHNSVNAKNVLEQI